MDIAQHRRTVAIALLCSSLALLSACGAAHPEPNYEANVIRSISVVPADPAPGEIVQITIVSRTRRFLVEGGLPTLIRDARISCSSGELQAVHDSSLGSDGSWPGFAEAAALNGPDGTRLYGRQDRETYRYLFKAPEQTGTVTLNFNCWQNSLFAVEGETDQSFSIEVR